MNLCVKPPRRPGGKVPARIWPDANNRFHDNDDLTVICHSGNGLRLSAPSLFIAPARRFPSLRLVLGHGGGSIFYAEAIVAAEVCPNIGLPISKADKRNVPSNTAARLFG